MSLGITKATLDFEKLKDIGQQGRNSEVYLAHDKQLDAEIVIKKVAKVKIVNPTDFYKEAQKLYSSEHQHVVQIKYACEDTDHIYLAMPFYKRGSLKTLIDGRFLTIREIIRYATQFLSGLHNIHVKKLIHFDVKPDNILLSDADEALMSDFGLSKSMNMLGFSTVDAVYPRQFPPELFTQTHHSMLYDIYNAGLTLYRMCNGNQHYYNQIVKYPSQDDYIDAVKKGAFPDRNSYWPHVPKNLRKVINKALSINQADRQQTILELINDLSPVNQLLDWQFEILANGYHLWTLTNSEKIITVLLKWDTAGTVFEVETDKTIVQSGNTSKVTAGCKRGISSKDVNKHVQDILLSQE